MNVSIFNYSELCHELTAYLSRGDIAVCLLVNKQLHSAFIPYLYKSITITDYTQYLPQLLEGPSSSGYAPTQESPESQAKTSADTVQQLLSALRRRSPPLTGLRAYGHMVESLTIEFQEDIEFGQRSFLYSEDPLPDTYPGLEQADTFVNIIKSCPFYRLKSLEIHGAPSGVVSRPTSYQCGTMNKIHLSNLELQQISDLAVSRIIEAAAAAAAAVVATAEATVPATTMEIGIRRIFALNANSFGRHSLQAITDTYSLSQSLEELYVHCCGYFRSEEMHFALRQLPNLKVADLRCRGDSPFRPQYSGLLPKMLSDVEIVILTEYDETPVLPPTLWACRNSLECLRIGVTNVCQENDCYSEYLEWIYTAEVYWLKNHPETKKSYPEKLHWFFDQIATLTQLKELCLVTVKPSDAVTRSLEISLKTGLARWSTLTALECLDVEELDHAIGLEDVKWMVGNWPALKMIKGLVYRNDELPSDAVVWLRETRPDIVLPVSTRFFIDRLPVMCYCDYPDFSSLPLPEEDDEL
ncbi:hypothetical protein BGX26_008377 [Mortierella sp. AD094]|nr:hypothetical protein BGX26_008377 [Mortierella sp. AD094]